MERLDDTAFAALPPPQQLAIDRVLLRQSTVGPMTDQRAVGAAFISVVERLAGEAPLLVAIDDLQWLDPPSRLIISAATRRLSGPIGVLATARDGPDDHDVASWLELRQPDRMRRVRVRPLSLGALHAVLSERLGRSFSRPKIRRIQEFSGGNPFYALELGHVMGDDTWRDGAALPSTLAELVRARLASLTVDGRNALLAAACLATPTLDLIARATHSDTEHIVEVLEEAESKGIVQIDGQRVTFTHPLLARGVYTDTAPGGRREMHRRLAEIVDEPELKARHLALAAARGDDLTLRSLDTAAQLAQMRGAPTAAAELIELAMELGGDTPERRIRLAAYHFDAGEPGRARTVLEGTVERLGAGTLRAQALSLLAMVRLFGDSFVEAATLLERGLDEAGDDLALRVEMLTRLSFARFNVGLLAAALDHAEDAVTGATQLGQPHLLSQALSMRVMVRFLRGDGLDEPSLGRALELEDPEAVIPSAFRPSVQKALLLACIGRLEQARAEMQVMRRRYVERGDEFELLFIDFHTVLLGIWRGDFAEVTLVAEDLMERALQLGGDLPLCLGLTTRGALAAYAGRIDEARSDATDALEAGQRSSSHNLSGWPVTILGFLDVSLGNYDAALVTLQPQVSRLDAAPAGTEIIAASFVPDAVEAMIQLGRLDDAEPLIERLERNGERLDRAWMLAVGARGRSMLLAARGDLEGASSAGERALAEHRRLPMPFELARTQLLMGQLQRRQKQREAASATLRVAVATFEKLGAPLWAERARAELDRASGARTRAELTASERRVAELAATGVTNRQMAAALFISPKTVEANLSRIYRKLNIRSRAELGRIMGSAEA
jgi:ATP/maltotriose-dependent transcriptional regulator MalT